MEVKTTLVPGVGWPGLNPTALKTRTTPSPKARRQAMLNHISKFPGCTTEEIIVWCKVSKSAAVLFLSRAIKAKTIDAYRLDGTTKRSVPRHYYLAGLKPDEDGWSKAEIGCYAPRAGQPNRPSTKKDLRGCHPKFDKDTVQRIREARRNGMPYTQMTVKFMSHRKLLSDVVNARGAYEAYPL